jgi:hypothetical protein
MAFQTPITIEKALERISAHEYVLPAIQREFVWSTDQICRLFDSLMRGYPIGSFLFWRVEPTTLKKFVFYEFILHYHELTAPHCPKLDKYAKNRLTAVLDGQQRLTALNVGLRGSHAEKLPRKWSTNLDAYPVKRLHLNLIGSPPENLLDLKYDFRFLTPRQADQATHEQHWFPVSKILDMKAGVDLFRYIQSAGLADHPTAFETIDRLHRVVKIDEPISFFEEEEQDLEKVLIIFIRVNSGGTVLSYSDLLLSIATAEWGDRDAREAVNGLVDGVNKTGQGFDFSKDLVLKAGLVLTDIGDIRFKVSNFNQANMRVLDQNWEAIENALRLGVHLLANFGFSGQTLAADSVLIPIAYYLHHKGASGNFLTGSAWKDDRALIRQWVIRSLLKTGVWGSGLDTLLTGLRQKLRGAKDTSFPTAAIESEMTRLGKSPKFDWEEIEDLVSTKYSDKRTFTILTLLYPGVDVRNVFHIDHVFPQSLFSRKKLLKAGVPEAKIDALIDQVDGLPNLQLLEGQVNVEKQAQLPLDWARKRHPEPAAISGYLSSHDMHDLPADIAEFDSFYRHRSERMARRLSEMLGVATRPAEVVSA